MASPLRQQIKGDVVRTQSIEGRGRGLFATQQIAPKAQILFVARPLLIALENSKLTTHCYFCYKSTVDPINSGEPDSGRTLKTCSGCKTIRFCDQKCQKRAWSEYHKLECKLYGRLQPRTLPSTVRAIVRVLKQHEAGLIPGSEWDELLDLQSHYDDMLSAGGERWQDAFIMMKGIKTYCGTGHSQDTILRLTCTLLVNTFTLTNPALDSLGMVLHPKSALLNHSCDPNAFVRFDVPPAKDLKTLPPYGGVSVHALRPIAKDEEITISYVDTTFPFDRRQQELKSRYFFDCSCSLCSRGSTSLLDVFHLAAEKGPGDGHAQVDPAIKKIGDQAERFLLDVQSKSSILHTQVDNIKSVMKSLADTKGWPVYRYPWPQLRQELFLGLLAGGRFFEAMLHSATFARAIHPVLYPQEHHPLRVMQLWTFINLCRQCLILMMMGEKTQESTHFDQPPLGLLGCVLVAEIYKLVNTGIKTDGQLEKLANGAYEEVSAEGGIWISYISNPEGARRTALSWIDRQVREQLEREGVARGIIELSRLTPPTPGVRGDVSLYWAARAPTSKD